MDLGPQVFSVGQRPKTRDRAIALYCPSILGTALHIEAKAITEK
jgi:hypothetical protein